MRDEEKSKEQLIRELAELRVCHAKSQVSEQEREQLEQTLREQTHHLQERVKELQCLYGLSELVGAPEHSADEIFQGIVDLIPPSWQYPDITCARLTLEKHSYCTEHFQETAWKQSAPIYVQGEQKGVLEVYYLEAKPPSAEGPFLAEERALLNALAERLGKMLEYWNIRTELQQYRRQLEQKVNARTAELISINAQLEREIVERKRTEDALRESDARYRMLVESSSDHIFILNREGVYLSSNSRVKHLGFSEEQSLTGLRLDEVYDSELATYYQQQLSHVFATGQAITFEHSLPDAGRECYHIDTLYPLKKGDEIWAVGGICRDMTDRKRAEVVLQQSEQKYRQLVETLQEGIWVIDAQAYTTFANPRMAEMLGYTVEDMLGKHLFEFMDEQGVRLAQRNLERRQQGITEQHDFEFLRKDGNRIYTNIETSPIVDEQGAYAGAIAGVADMTERRLAEEQIKASLKEKELLLQEIHHRVKNNLQVIASLLYLQSTHIQDTQVQEQFLESRNRVRSIALAHETLYQSENLTHIDFETYIRRLVAQVLQAYREHSQRIDVNIRVQSVPLSIEAATPCGLMINELVSNALKHAFPHKAGELWVSFESSREQMYVLTVKDTGIGLPENFDMQKVESLGIKLMHSLVEQLDGTLDVATGNGTCVTVTFPEPEYTKRI